MRAIITVSSIDAVGIIAKISTYLAENNVNILDINQTIMGEFFTMIMLVDTSAAAIPFAEFVDGIDALADANNLKMHVQREDIFNTMHRI